MDCWGLHRSRKTMHTHDSYADELDSDENAPLLPEEHDRHHETALQASLHEKLHGYFMIKALKDGYLPSTEQFVQIIEAFLGNEVFKDGNWVYCGRDTREFVKLLRKLLQEVIEVAKTKNSGDELQELIWWTKKARVQLAIDVDDDFSIGRAGEALGGAARAQFASANAAYTAIQTLTSLVLANTDFQNLLQEISLITRQVFADTATATAKKLGEEGKEVAPDFSEITPPARKPIAAIPEAGVAGARLESYADIAGEPLPANGTPAPTASESTNPSTDEAENPMKSTAEDITATVAHTADSAANAAFKSIQENTSSVTPLGRHLRRRIRELIVNLRRDSDYETSISVLELLVKNYLKTYLSATIGGISTTVAEGLQDTVDIEVDASENNSALARTAAALFKVVGRFGNPEEWEELGRRVDDVMRHVMGGEKAEHDVDKVVDRLVEGVKDLVTDPEVWIADDDDIVDGYDEVKDRRLLIIRRRMREMFNINADTSLPAVQRSVDDLLNQMHTVYLCIKNDTQISHIITTATQLANILLPPVAATGPKKATKFGINAIILHDTSTTLFPLLLSIIQIIPIPRLTMTSPQLDLLLENLYIEPGKTINHSSFFPYNFALTTTSTISITKTPHPHHLSETFYGGITKTTSKISLRGITFSAVDIGYILKLKSGLGLLSLLKLTDQGLASITVDKKGIDIHLTVDVLTSPTLTNLNGSPSEPVESSLLKLKNVKVDIHTLKYTLRKSKYAWLIGTWPFRTLLEKLLKKIIANQAETAIADLLKWTNTELAFARERFRGARVANPKSLLAWWKAVKYRVWNAPVEPEPEVRVEIGMSSAGTAGPGGRAKQGGYTSGKGKGRRGGVFEGEYAPGSLVALWEEDVERAGEVVGRYGVVNGGGGSEGAEHVGERRRLKEGGWRNVVFSK